MSGNVTPARAGSAPREPWPPSGVPVAVVFSISARGKTSATAALPPRCKAAINSGEVLPVDGRLPNAQPPLRFHRRSWETRSGLRPPSARWPPPVVRVLHGARDDLSHFEGLPVAPGFAGGLAEDLDRILDVLGDVCASSSTPSAI